MNPTEYTTKCATTDASGSDAERVAIKSRLRSDKIEKILHAALGLATEAGEILDMLKKHIYYGKELDFVNLDEELGDLNWYQSLMISAMIEAGYETSWEQIWEKNIAKLESRYKGKFSEERAKDRDLETERRILEKSLDSTITIDVGVK